MIGMMRWRGTAKTLSVSLVLAMLLNLASPALAAPKSAGSTKLAGKVSEVSPPEVIQQLHDFTDKYQPQVSIVSPRPNEVLQDNTVSVKLNVQDLPLRKDEKFGLGSHLHVFLDDQPYQAVYDISQPVVFKDLAAGTHTIRAFAGRPWHESFKNDGAFAQTTFHIFTKTPNNNPDPKLPLLTYSRPQAAYGAEPILLDFYLTNAPLHLVAQEDDKDEVADWKIKVTVNGDSFTVDRWQPLYLKGFKPGKNWVQLEYVDDKGNPVPNVYNNTARVFTYEPNGQDGLSRLVRGEIPFGEAVTIIDPNYKPAVKAPEVAPTPEVAPVPVVPRAIAPEPEVSKPVEEAPKPVAEPQKEAPKPGFFNRFKKQPEAPKPEPKIEAPTITEPEVTEPKVSEPEVSEPEVVAPEVSKPEAPEVVAPASPKAPEKPKGGFFNRFKRPEPPKAPVEPSPVPETVTEPEAADEPEVLTPIVPEVQPVKPSPAPGGFFNRLKPPVTPIVPAPVEVPAIEPPAVETMPEPVEISPVPEVKEKPKSSFFDRFKRPEVKPAPTPIEQPAPVEEAPIEQPKPVDAEPPAVLETKPAEEAKPEKPNLIERLRQAPPKPAEPPAIEKVEPPVVEEAPSETPPPSDFEPQTELERRLGMPLKPRVAQPAPSPEPALSSEGNAE